MPDELGIRPAYDVDAEDAYDADDPLDDRLDLLESLSESLKGEKASYESRREVRKRAALDLIDKVREEVASSSERPRGGAARGGPTDTSEQEARLNDIHAAIEEV